MDATPRPPPLSAETAATLQRALSHNVPKLALVSLERKQKQPELPRLPLHQTRLLEAQPSRSLTYRDPGRFTALQEERGKRALC